MDAPLQGCGVNSGMRSELQVGQHLLAWRCARPGNIIFRRRKLPHLQHVSEFKNAGEATLAGWQPERSIGLPPITLHLLLFP